MLILDLLGIGFHAVVVFSLGKDFLFKSILGRCCESTKVGSTGRDLQLKKVNMNCPHPPRLPLKFNNREHSRVQSAGRKKLKPALFEKLHTFSRYKVNRISLRCWLEKWLSRGANDRLLRSVDFCIH